MPSINLVFRATATVAFMLAILILPEIVCAAEPNPGASLAAAAATETSRPTIYIAGDSTASNGRDLGWGSHLGKFFDPSKVNVANRAIAGRSSRTFITEGRWDGILRDLKPGDFVLLQFGHNDAGAINDNSRSRGSIPSLGEETQEIDNLVTRQHEVVHTFGWYMRKMISETQANGATPIVMSMTVRNVWPNGEIERQNTFCNLSEEVAAQEEVAFVPIREISADQYELLGPIRVRQLHPVDHTHTSADGAYLNAAIVVSGLKALKCSLAECLNDLGRSVSAYGPDLMVEPVKQWMTTTWMPEVQPESDPNKPTLYVIGDSTVRTGTRGDGSNGQWGWGAPIADFFDRTRLNVENCALGGTSSRTFRTLGLWDKVLERLKPGDFVIMQFGHNDSSPVNDPSRARGTIRGNGEETQEIDNMLTGEHEVVHSYGWYIRRYIIETKAKGATPIVCSPIPRNNWSNGKINRAASTYGLWAAQAAQAEDAKLIDLNQLICDHYDAVGRQRVTALYFDARETTHTNAMGAQCNATCVVSGIKALEGCNLADYLKVVRPQ